MISETNRRNSSFELLRIIAILMIISLHYSFWGNYDFTSYKKITSGAMFVQIVQMYGRMACSIFVLITGYFMGNSKRNSFYKKIIRLMLQLLFYSLVVTIAISIYEGGEDKINFLYSFFPFVFNNWYIVFYIILLLFVPMLNNLVQSLEEKKYKKMMIIMFFIWCVIPTLTLNYWKFSQIDFFIFMYLLGAYISKYGFLPWKYNNIWNLIISSVCMIIMAISVVIIDKLAIVTQNNKWLSYVYYFKEYNTIFACLAAVFLFVFFSNIRFYNKYINWMATSILGIYLIHDQYLIRDILWNKILPNAEYVEFPYIHWLMKIVLVFVMCLLIEKIRAATVGKFFEPRIIALCEKIHFNK